MVSPAAIMAAAAAWTALCVSFLLSRALSETRWLQDRPNERSAHARATPRSGGVAIFAAWITSMSILALLSKMSGVDNDFLMFAMFATIAFAVGLADDLLTLKPLVKLAGQVFTAAAFLYHFDPVSLPALQIFGDAAANAGAYALTMFAIVAFMNAYNFMDGVNGLAASCGAFVMAALAVASVGAGDLAWSMTALMLAVSIFGFIPTNLNRGALFMGDAGSQFIGFTIAALAVVCANSDAGPVSILFAPIAFMPFLFDVAVTLIVRAARGRNILSAHREHIYQRLFMAGVTHGGVTSIYLCLTAISTALAMMMTLLHGPYQLIAPVMLTAAFIPLALFVYRFTNPASSAGDDDRFTRVEQELRAAAE
ncbi:MAG: glycosyltransferase family 4 protein [Parvularculaceae bacterium]